MQRNFAATIAQVIVFLAFSVLVFFLAVQVNHLEQLVIDGSSKIAALDTTVARLRNELESGALTVSTGGPRNANNTEDGPWIRRFYSDEQWEQLTAPGNYFTYRTQPYNPSGSTAGGTINRAAMSDIPGLNPITQNAADVSEIYHYVTEGLATRQRNDPERWVGELATRIEVNEDHTEYHVWLRDDVIWHPPAVDLDDPRYTWLQGERKLIADDFVFYLELAKNPQVDAAHLRNYYEDCEGIEVINDHEFIVRWSKPLFHSISFTLGLAPLPRWLYGADQDGRLYDPAEVGRRFNEHWYNQGAIGVGPYRFVRWVPGGEIRLERFDRYYGEKPPIANIIYRVISDPTARLNNLAAGGVDFVDLQQSQYKNAVLDGGISGFADGTLEYETFQGPSYRYLGWNADGPFFGDRRVRLAMTHAFDRELLLRENMHGLGRITTGTFFIDGPDYNHDIEAWSFDLERAAQLLTEAGWVDNNGDGIREKLVDGELLNFNFGMVTYGNRPEFIAAMEHYRNDLRSIGVILNVEPVEWAVMIERMEEKDFDAYTGGWVLGWDADPYQIWHSSQADEPKGSNRVGFRNAEADRIIEEARQTFDPATRTELFHRFHEIIHEEQPYTFWFAGLEIGAWRNNLDNVSFSPISPFASSRDWYFSP